MPFLPGGHIVNNVYLFNSIFIEIVIVFLLFLFWFGFMPIDLWEKLLLLRS